MPQPPSAMELLDPAALSKLGSLEVIATRIVEGFLSGKHRSPYKGSSVEFSEHRLYSPGDELRLLDWRALARSERHYIKQFEDESNLQATLVVDASGSMGFGHSTITKLRYAQMACACLARMMLHQRDAVGLAVADSRLREYIPPRSRAGHLHVLIEALHRSRASGETSVASALHDLARRVKRRGLVILCSDCFEELDELLTAMQRLRSRGQELLLLHIMAPEELSFSFMHSSQFESLEMLGQRIELDPGAVRAAYLARVKIFLEQLQAGCSEMECEYMPLSTDQPLGEILAFHLARRAARMKW